MYACVYINKYIIYIYETHTNISYSANPKRRAPAPLVSLPRPPLAAPPQPRASLQSPPAQSDPPVGEWSEG